MYDKIIITIVPAIQEKNITRLLLLALLLLLCTQNNTDGNKLVIFSSIVLYYSDTYMLVGADHEQAVHYEVVNTKMQKSIL